MPAPIATFAALTQSYGHTGAPARTYRQIDHPFPGTEAVQDFVRPQRLLGGSEDANLLILMQPVPRLQRLGH